MFLLQVKSVSLLLIAAARDEVEVSDVAGELLVDGLDGRHGGLAAAQGLLLHRAVPRHHLEGRPWDSIQYALKCHD